jgi:NUMOD3 motif
MFYVYEHWRPDKNECFYVGKGTLARAHHMVCRNKLHKAITSHLRSHGFKPEVRIIFSLELEQEAYEKEERLISEWRSKGNPLRANFRIGGRGNSGWKHTEETKARMSAARKGKKRPEVQAEKHPMFGKKFGFHLTRDLAEENKKRIWDDEARKRHSEALSGRVMPVSFRKGQKLGEETRKRMSEGQKLRHAKLREQRDAACTS